MLNQVIEWDIQWHVRHFPSHACFQRYLLLSSQTIHLISHFERYYFREHGNTKVRLALLCVMRTLFYRMSKTKRHDFIIRGYPK
jgi:hypothetical protein